VSLRRTRAAIVGTGPAGLMLGRLIERQGIENVILEPQMLDVDPAEDAYGEQPSRSQVRYVCKSRAAATSLAENYVGLPFETSLGG